MWINRIARQTIEQALATFPAVLVTGPRQVGKTSLLTRLLPSWSYVSFDVPSLAAQAEENPQQFLLDHPAPCVLDEIQYVPSLFRHLKIAIDSAGAKPGQYAITGSQSFALMEGVSESLAGRCAVLEMNSLGVQEMEASPVGLNENDYLIRGGFPALYAEAAPPLPMWHGAYLATYLERDVRNLKQVGSLRDFDRFIRAFALRTGQLLNFTDLARDVGIAPNTARAWTSVLQASGQVALLEPYHRSLGKRLVKSPKVYFLDPGLVAHLVGLASWQTLGASPLAGALWENYVIGQVLRALQAAGQYRPAIWFWRTSQGQEVDLVLEAAGQYTLIECKFSETPDPRAATKGFKAFGELYGAESISKRFVVCRTQSPFTTAIPDGSRVDILSPVDLLKRL